ncbi:unnamed protein product [Orchesella dallaii]|uniref:Uncharacterized protein n=1 Tax=Orchesella dallaii TaxID=48710 RepID=A0ABP1R9E1_9HEXA
MSGQGYSYHPLVDLNRTMEQERVDAGIYPEVLPFPFVVDTTKKRTGSRRSFPKIHLTSLLRKGSFLRKLLSRNKDFKEVLSIHLTASSSSPLSHSLRWWLDNKKHSKHELG